MLMTDCLLRCTKICFQCCWNESVFSCPRRLKMCRCPHLLLYAVLWRCGAAAPAMQQLIDISYLPGPQQQACCMLLPWLNGTDRQMDRQRDTVSFHRPCYTWWLGSRVVSVLDSVAEGPEFKSQSRRCRVTVLGKLFTPIAPLFTNQRNWYQPS